MEQVRKPFQGVWNVVRFNWHFYLFAFIFLSGILLLGFFVDSLKTYSLILFFVAFATTFISLAATYYAYDLSNLYSLNWLNDLQSKEREKVININAGFDEISELVQSRYKNAELIVFDFYDPAQHTEVSIKRARKAYPPYPNTKQIKTAKIPLNNSVADKIFAVLSAHEIRNPEERTAFFRELHRVLEPDGRVIVTEHLRDWKNFLAYNIGFFHFHSRQAWLRNFREAGFTVDKEIKINLFMTAFILKKI